MRVASHKAKRKHMGVCQRWRGEIREKWRENATAREKQHKQGIASLTGASLNRVNDVPFGAHPSNELVIALQCYWKHVRQSRVVRKIYLG